MPLGYGDRRTHKGRDEAEASWCEWFCNYVENLNLDADEFAFQIQEIRKADCRSYNWETKSWFAMHAAANILRYSGCAPVVEG